jgi:putative peptidoglycan lipid II flippase
MNVFFINFIIQGISKVLGFKKKYDILNLLGTTTIGDVYKLSYNWPNLFKRILVDGTLDFVIIPYLLEGQSINHQEFQTRISQIVNTFIIILIILMIIFFFIVPILSKNILYENINYFYKKFFLLIIPMTFSLIFNNIVQSKCHFIYSNLGQIINNIIFIILISFTQKNPLETIWISIMMGFVFHSFYLLFLIIKNNYYKFSWQILPSFIIFNLIKSALFQLCNRFNHLVANFLGYRTLMTPGILMAMDFADSLLNSIIGVVAITIITIITSNFFKYFSLKDNQYKKYCQKIIIGMMVLAFIISGFIFLNNKSIVYFLFYKKFNINQLLLCSILKWSSGQIILLFIIKIIQRILTIEKLLNKSLIIAGISSVISVVIEIYLYPKYNVYGLLISQYSFMIIELISIIHLLKHNTQWKNLWNNTNFNIYKISFKIIFLLIISKLINYKIFTNHFHIKFLIVNGGWGLLTLIILWPYIKIFFIKIKE